MPFGREFNSRRLHHLGIQPHPIKTNFPLLTKDFVLLFVQQHPELHTEIHHFLCVTYGKLHTQENRLHTNGTTN